MIEEGIYKARILNKKDAWGVTKAKSGNFQFFVKIKVLAPVDDGQEIDQEAGDLVRTIFMPITDKTRARVLGDLKSAGYDRPTLLAKALQPGFEESHNFADRDVLVKCEHDESWPPQNPKPREKWQLYKEREKLADEDLSQFDSVHGLADVPDNF